MQLQLFHSIDKDKPLRVEKIPYEDAKQFLLPRHYSGRMPIVSHAYGWIQGNTIRACLTIGKPASPFVCSSPFGEEYSPMVYELSRLCSDGGSLPPLSKFLGECLRMLKDMNIVLVSYADTGMNHNGYIYQATNWIYTGKTKERIVPVTKDGKHCRHNYKKDGDIFQLRTAKHRYLYYCLRSKSYRKKLQSLLRWDIEPYPKGINKRYKVEVQ
jgi:hypothetical protein